MDSGCCLRTLFPNKDDLRRPPPLWRLGTGTAIFRVAEFLVLMYSVALQQSFIQIKALLLKVIQSTAQGLHFVYFLSVNSLF